MINFLWVLFLSAWYSAGSAMKGRKHQRCGFSWRRLGNVLFYHFWCTFFRLICGSYTSAAKATLPSWSWCPLKWRRNWRRLRAAAKATFSSWLLKCRRLKKCLPKCRLLTKCRHRIQRYHLHWGLLSVFFCFPASNDSLDRRQKKDKLIAEDLYRRLTPTLFVVSNAADADTALDWVFAAEMHRRSKLEEIPYRIFVVTAVFSAIGSFLWILSTFDILGVSLPSPSDQEVEKAVKARKKWSPPRNHCLWRLPTKTQIVFLAILFEDVPQIVISSHVKLEYTDIVTSSALANIVTSAYAVGLKFVQSWIEKSAKEFDIVTTINLANSLRYSGGFEDLIKARKEADTNIETAVNGLAFQSMYQYCDTQNADFFGHKLKSIRDASTQTGDVRFVNGMSDEQGKQLAEAIDGNRTCRGFSFDGTVGLVGLEAIAKVIRTTAVNHLFFVDKKTKRGDSYLEILARHRVLEQLKTLGITSSGVTDKGVTILAQQLRTNRSLKFIVFHLNVIGIDGAIALEEALSMNKTVHTIHLFGNRRIVDSSNTFTPPNDYAGHHTFDQLRAALSDEGRQLPLQPPRVPSTGPVVSSVGSNRSLELSC